MLRVRKAVLRQYLRSALGVKFVTLRITLFEDATDVYFSILSDESWQE